MKLPEPQVSVLNAASADTARSIEELAEKTNLPPETVTGAAFALEEAGLVSLEERTTESVSVTPEGHEYLETQLPELTLYQAALEAGADESPIELGEVLERADLEGSRVDIALSNFSRKEYGSVEDGHITINPTTTPDEDPEAEALSAIDAGDNADQTVMDTLERRGLIDRQEGTSYTLTLTEDGVTALMEGIEVSRSVDQLTADHLTTDQWEALNFTDYNVEAGAERVTGGRIHPLRQLIERVKDVLIGMGFQEMEGPHADAEFWINDCLFMPQDHPARTHWDQFVLDLPPMQELPDDLVERVRETHLEGVGSEGDGYHSPWTESVARRIDLRGHTTSLSSRYLAGEADVDLEPPERYFSVEKAYRNDVIDATHLLEFFQIEGWVLADELSVPDLMGTFTDFYAQFGITNLEFKPTYNPYTEPSFELFGTHPETNELVEIGNSGMFRPEMLEPLGVEADVMAWGISLERLMMLMTGAEDIRDVHGTLVDLEYLRTEEVIY